MAISKQRKIKEVKEETKQTSKLLIAAIIAAVILFIFGFLLGNYIVNNRMESFKQTEETFLVHLIGLEMRDQVLNSSDICSLDSNEVWSEKVDLGNMLSSLEVRLGKENPDVLLEKEVYELIEIRTLSLVKEIKDNCHEDFSIILFFYTNKANDPKGSVGGSDDQGIILDNIVSVHNYQGQGKKVYVFAFDINSKNPATRALVSKYDVEKVPTLMINGDKYGYLVQSQIEELV